MSVDEAIRLAYAKANQSAQELLKNTSPVRLRGQMRRYVIDDAFAGISKFPSVNQTVPKGEHFVVLCSGDLTLSHIELHENALARPAKHRAFLAKKNAILEPYTPDFFEPSLPEFDKCLHLVAVIVHPNPKEKDQSKPQQVFISVPYTDWSGYHLEVAIDKLISDYDEHKDKNYSVPDDAWPTLRDDLIDLEKPTSQ